MQVVLIKQEKGKLVIRLHTEDENIQEIAHIVHLSFTDIVKIIRSITVLKDETVDLKKNHKILRQTNYLIIVLIVEKI